MLITGAASGLGRAFVGHYIRTLWEGGADARIYALDIQQPELGFRDHSQNGALLDWIQTHVVMLEGYDLTNSKHIKDLTAVLGDVELELIVHCAGIRGLVRHGQNVENYGDVRRSEDLNAMDAETMRKAFDVNVLGTFELLRACVPALKQKTQVRNGAYDSTASDDTGKRTVPKVIVMGSRMGSIGHNHPDSPNAGAAYAYRASKAAVNAVVRSLAVDVPEVIWTVVHPGRVETGLVQVKEDNAMPADESIRDMVRLIETLKMEDSGRFVDRFGKDIPF